jgi:hypothetical protein
MKKQLLMIVLVSVSTIGFGQSLELMVGHERLFADVQWLKFVDKNKQLSIFSRTRATVDYENTTDLFSGAYLNYTSKIGIGVSLVGRIGANGAGTDVGVHFFKAKKEWMLFGLASVALKNELEYSWFSIFRYTPVLKENWKWYSSLELFTLFNQNNHVFSVQRLRLGLDYKGFQFGVGGNFSQLGTALENGTNIGGFARKIF